LNLLISTGAKFYYLRAIFHDYPDDKCVLILKNLIPVMDKESRILIDEVVPPNQGVHWQASQMDLTMMAALGAKERTKEEWNSLVDSAGLKVLQVYTYTLTLQNSVLVIGLK
jgi:demethylsterigmatocystin 6-O-methyltransferase